jgi:hypothetical protein
MEIIVLVFVAWWLYCGLKGWLGSLGSTGEQASSTAAASPPPQPVTRERTAPSAEALERAGLLRDAAEARERKGELWHAAGLWAQVGDHEREARAWDRLGRPEAAARARAQARGSVERVAGGSGRQGTSARPASVSYAPQEAAAQPKVEAAPRDGLVWRPSPRPRFVRLGEDPGPR